MPLARRHLPPVQTLQAFEAVARLGSFTQAADELSLTQSAVSRQVAALEKQLGARLLSRGPRIVSPTREGAAYAQSVRAALDQLHRAALALQGADSPGQLSLAIPPTFGTRWLIPRLPRFLRAHPEITLQLTTRIGRFDLAEDGIDAAIHAGQPDWPETHATLLREETVQPVVAASLGARDMDDILRLDQLSLASRPTEWATWMAAHGFSSSNAPAMVFEHLAALAQACAAGLGVALLPPFLFRGEMARGEICPLGPEWANGSGYWLIEPDRARAKPAVAALRDWLVTETTRDEGAFA